MTLPLPQPDLPEIAPLPALSPELLDEFLTIIQTGDESRQRAFCEMHPGLREWNACLSALNQFSAHIPRSATEPVRLRSTFARLELLDEIGRGGMGVVYRARQLDLQRIVAVKLILADRLASSEEVQRFQNEARAAASLRHPNIVAIHAIGESDGQHYFVMEYVAGESLAERLCRGPLPIDEAARLLVKIAGAIHHLHLQGIIHRDIKPSNILLDQQGEPFVTDFGLAKIFENDHGQTRTGAIVGTPSYMSPEQASGRTRLISPRSDVYSLGAMLYEMLTGRPPFREEHPLDTLVQVLEGEPTLPRHLNPQVGRDLELICLKCLDKDPERRYASAADLADDIGRYLRGEGVAAHSGWMSSLRRWMRRQPGLACHWGAQAAAALIMQIHFTIDYHPEDAALHRTFIGIIGLWATLSYVCQLLQRYEGGTRQAHLASIFSDVILLTVALSMSQGPVSSLLVIYPLLITASGLWFRVPLVWLTTAVSSAGFLCLVMVKPDFADPWHYPLLVLSVLVMVGAATAYQVKRVRALSRYYERRPDIG